MIKRLLAQLFIAALLWPGFAPLAQATTWYFAACGAQAASTCVAGSEANDGLTSATPKLLISTAKTKWDSLAAGDSILWARGSDQTGRMNSLSGTGCTAATPCTMGAYTPSWLANTYSGNNSAVTATTVSVSGSPWSTNALANDYEITTRDHNGAWIVLQICSNTTSVLTLCSAFPELPAVGAAFTIQGRAPIIRDVTAGTVMIQLVDSGNVDHNEGAIVQDVHLIGYTPGVAVAAMNGSGGTLVTVDTSGNHGLSNGDTIAVIGASISAFNTDNHAITVVDSDTFTYTCSTGCTGTPTGATYTKITGWGIRASNDQDYTIVQRVEVEGPATGVECQGGTTNTINGGSDGISEHFILRDSYMHHSSGAGALMGCNDTLLEGNTFSRNSVNGLGHHVYFDDPTVNAAINGGVAQLVTQQVFKHNTLIDNSLDAPGKCPGAAMVLHGLKNGIHVIGNLLKETTVPASSQCWGIAPATPGYNDTTYGDETFRNVVITNNRIVNFQTGIAVDNCILCTIENNYVYSTFPSGVFGITMRSQNFVPGTEGTSSIHYAGAMHCGGSACLDTDADPDKVRIRHNTVYLTAPNGSSWGISLNGNGGDHLTGANHELANNLVFLGSTATTADQYYQTQNILLASFAAPSLSNIGFTTSASVPKFNRQTTLASSQGAGFDTGSSICDPSITAPSAPLYLLDIPTGSCAKNAGNATYSSLWDVRGYLRSTSGDTVDVGAFEFNATATPVPSTATRITIQ